MDDHDVLLLDLDGVVYVGPDAVPGAAQALNVARRRGTRAVFVTNNAARTPADVARHLCELSVQATASDVVTSAQAAARMLAADLDEGARVLVVGGEGLREAVREVGLVPVDRLSEEPEAVVQGFSRQTSWAELDEACVAVRHGLRWVATNVDSTLPTPRGPAPGNGAFVEVVARTTGAQPQVAGKPAPALLETAVDRTQARRPLFVGDRLDTDVAGASALRMPSLQVLTGVSAVVDLLAAGPPSRPTYLAAGLAGLLDQHRAPEREDAGPDRRPWFSAAGGIRARWNERDGLLVRAPEPEQQAPRADEQTGLEVLRVACAAVWSAADDGQPVDLAQARTVLAAWTAPCGWDR